jgi:hypothetical protein
VLHRRPHPRPRAALRRAARRRCRGKGARRRARRLRRPDQCGIRAAARAGKVARRHRRLRPDPLSEVVYYFDRPDLARLADRSATRSRPAATACWSTGSATRTTRSPATTQPSASSKPPRASPVSSGRSGPSATASTCCGREPGQRRRSPRHHSRSAADDTQQGPARQRRRCRFQRFPRLPELRRTAHPRDERGRQPKRQGEPQTIAGPRRARLHATEEPPTAEPPERIGRRLQPRVGRRGGIRAAAAERVGHAARCPADQPAGHSDARRRAVPHSHPCAPHRLEQGAILADRHRREAADPPIGVERDCHGCAGMDAVARPGIMRGRVDQPRQLVQKGGVGPFVFLADAQRGRQAGHLRGVGHERAGNRVGAGRERREIRRAIRRRPSVGIGAHDVPACVASRDAGAPALRPPSAAATQARRQHPRAR